MTAPTLEEKRVRLAEACGPKLFVIHAPKNSPYGYYYREGAHGYTGSLSDAWKVTEEEGRKYTLYADSKPGDRAYPERVVLEPAPLPDYFRCLDACAEAERVLTEEQWDDYLIHICVGSRLDPDCTAAATARAVRQATAAICAEALGRTLGLWG